MTLYVLRRFVNYAILSLIATCIAYVLASSIFKPGDRYYGMNPRPPQESIDASLAALGQSPDVPVIVRLWHWLVGLFTQGSLGITVGGQPVMDEIVARSGASLRLLLIGSILGAVIGVLLGVWGAVRQYRASDQIVTYSSFLIFATPTFVIGVLLMIAATALNNAVGSQLITFTGEYSAGISGSWWDLTLDRGIHLLLPTIALVLMTAATDSRYQRSVMLDVLGADYIRTARSKGLERGPALFRHGVRIALIPMSTFFAYGFGTLIAGSAMLEIVFSWRGMGQFTLQAVTTNDVNAAAGSTLFIAVLVLLSSTASEILYAALDPRVRS
ncbi:ABC transporter permease [Microbacterium sp. EYE_5]|uniref:ABC transporter permease n=1 Tax=unclassified Microbacterium TaxID=2609290 RepID=UPI00200462CA|nr:MULTISPECIES: ABC transporter permease [unclassified Microbacterium]MCK6081050.1 ABC transporter permease [Microbacterium sp. EYE_382]MCK6086320.1 ABC transporter permease [Microbacterium sp. EYE_384]MCK6124182.1 ABC transporter permease [Microbacterium sp. EYE_80]MCK6127091.1 ABC transporter permease [Microbacterium sp. EYE_79]MCK6142005.1 ABC transporter permease [Microbacterium sp. EYE_39]